jgi:Flp pilus assembly protein TadG
MHPGRSDRKAGVAMVETCLAIAMLCIILFGILQVSYLVAARDVISFSAFAAARSATVGLNEDFVSRVVRVVSIPTAGPMKGGTFVDHVNINPDQAVGSAWNQALQAAPYSDQYWVEKNNIPYYLGARSEAELDYYLSYYNWVNTDTAITASMLRETDGSVYVYVEQGVPLAFPFARGFYRKEIGTMTRVMPSWNGSEVAGYSEQILSVPISEMSEDLSVEDHSALYLTTP